MGGGSRHQSTHFPASLSLGGTGRASTNSGWDRVGSHDGGACAGHALPAPTYTKRHWSSWTHGTLILAWLWLHGLKLLSYCGASFFWLPHPHTHAPWVQVLEGLPSSQYLEAFWDMPGWVLQITFPLGLDAGHPTLPHTTIVPPPQLHTHSLPPEATG